METSNPFGVMFQQPKSMSQKMMMMMIYFPVRTVDTIPSENLTLLAQDVVLRS
jgi:hypothetical protein